MQDEAKVSGASSLPNCETQLYRHPVLTNSPIQPPRSVQRYMLARTVSWAVIKAKLTRARAVSTSSKNHWTTSPSNITLTQPSCPLEALY